MSVFLSQLYNTNKPYNTTLLSSSISPLNSISVYTPVGQIKPVVTSPIGPANVYEPYSNMYSPNGIDLFSPTNPYTTLLKDANVTVFSPFDVNKPYLTPTLVTAFVPTETGLSDSYLAQKEMTKYLHERILNKWMYSDLSHVLKYLKVNGDKVDFIGASSEFKSNKIANDSIDDVEKKTDFIAEHILTENDMRKILNRVTKESGLKWYDLPKIENMIVDTVEKFILKKMKERVSK